MLTTEQKSGAPDRPGGIAASAVGDHAGHRGQQEAADGVAQLELPHQPGDPRFAAEVRRPDRKADCRQQTPMP